MYREAIKYYQLRFIMVQVWYKLNPHKRTKIKLKFNTKCPTKKNQFEMASRFAHHRTIKTKPVYYVVTSHIMYVDWLDTKMWLDASVPDCLSSVEQIQWPEGSRVHKMPWQNIIKCARKDCISRTKKKSRSTHTNTIINISWLRLYTREIHIIVIYIYMVLRIRTPKRQCAQQTK